MKATPIAMALAVMGAVAAQSQSVPAATPKFEVASIRECAGGETHPPGKSSPGRLSLSCMPLRMLIQQAYDVFEDGKVNPRNPSFPLTPLEGGPEWLNSARYSINATTAEPETVTMMRGPIMRRLLEDRFRIRVHREIREASVYIMTVAKDGPKLRLTKEGSCKNLDPTDPTQSLKIMPGDKPWCVITTPTHNGSHWVWDVDGMSTDVLAKMININGIHVIDQTGLTGTYDIHLEWEYTPPGPAAPESGAASEPPRTTIASAMREQLGLQLMLGKGPREYLVIDHLERPSEN